MSKGKGKIKKIYRAVGRIEGQMGDLCKLSTRVSTLERWQSWLKGGFAALAAAWTYLCRASFGK